MSKAVSQKVSKLVAKSFQNGGPILSKTSPERVEKMLKICVFFLSPLGSKCGPQWISKSIFVWGFWCSWPSLGAQGSQSGFWEPKWSPRDQNGRQNWIQWHQIYANCSLKKGRITHCVLFLYCFYRSECFLGNEFSAYDVYDLYPKAAKVLCMQLFEFCSILSPGPKGPFNIWL